MVNKKITFEDVAYTPSGVPRTKMRRGTLSPSGKLKPGRGVSALPKGWSWKKPRK